MMDPRDMISDSDDILDDVLIELHGLWSNTENSMHRRSLETLIGRVERLQEWLPTALAEEE